MSESFQLADRKVGGVQLYRSLVSYLRLEIAPSLLDLLFDCSSSELFSAAASLTDAAGWMAHDGGNDEASQRHFTQAYHLAVAAENPVLSANVCASLSHLAVQRGQAADAERISAAGLARAIHDEGVEQMVARLHAMHAREAAMPGFDEASLASEAALCFYSLGALGEAENQARKVIEPRRSGDRVRSRTLGQLTLAHVLLKSGAVDEAARMGSEICLAVEPLNSARVRSGISRLGESLRASRAVPDVTLFLGHLTQLAEKPVAASRNQNR